MQHPLELVLQACKKRLHTLQQSQVIVDKDRSTFLGNIGEAHVKQWLTRCNVTFDYQPIRPTEYILVETTTGVRVRKDNRDIVEFDFVVAHQGIRYVIEVKSMGLNGVAGKINTALTVAHELYGDTTRMLLLFPMYHNKIEDARRLQEQFPIQCVDIGFRKRELNEYADRAARF